MSGDTATVARPRPTALARQRRTARGDEVEDLRSLLLQHLRPDAGPPAQAADVAEAVAVGCLGDAHLWQDLQFPSRAALSALMRHWFPALVERNHADMKWKKFLYRELCLREAILVCRAPSCAVCSEQPLCFGPEI